MRQEKGNWCFRCLGVGGGSRYWGLTHDEDDDIVIIIKAESEFYFLY